jgi:hypothetical protein
MKKGKEVTIRPATFRNTKDRDKARTLQARALLAELIVAEIDRVGRLRWAAKGGLELEEIYNCLEFGGVHPLLKEWTGKRSGFTNRPPTSPRELHSQWLVCMATIALVRAYNLTQAEAREVVAKKAARMFDRAPTAKAIEHWEARRSKKLHPDEEQMLATAVHNNKIQGGKRDDLAEYFIGIANAIMAPAMLIDEE